LREMVIVAVLETMTPLTHSKSFDGKVPQGVKGEGITIEEGGLEGGKVDEEVVELVEVVEVVEVVGVVEIEGG